MINIKLEYLCYFRCYFIALTYMAGQKWAETRALFQRAGAYANRVKNDTILPQAMREEMQALMQLIESKQFTSCFSNTDYFEPFTKNLNVLSHWITRYFKL